MNCLNNLTSYTSYRNLRCPKTICNENIKEVVLEKLFSPCEFEKYTKIIKKVDGLYDPLNFPCPSPNCDSDGSKGDIKNRFKL